MRKQRKVPMVDLADHTVIRKLANAIDRKREVRIRVHAAVVVAPARCDATDTPSGTGASKEKLRHFGHIVIISNRGVI